MRNVTLLDVNIVGTTAYSASMSTKVRLFNPSVGGVVMGPVLMGFEQGGVVLGESRMPNFRLNPSAVDEGVTVLTW